MIRGWFAHSASLVSASQAVAWEHKHLSQSLGIPPRMTRQEQGSSQAPWPCRWDDPWCTHADGLPGCPETQGMTTVTSSVWVLGQKSRERIMPSPLLGLHCYPTSCCPSLDSGVQHSEAKAGSFFCINPRLRHFIPLLATEISLLMARESIHPSPTCRAPHSKAVTWTSCSAWDGQASSPMSCKRTQMSHLQGGGETLEELFRL